MDTLAVILVVFVALFHVQVFIMEALLWKTERAMKAFGTTPKTAEITYPLAINQGVYNLFLAAGLFLSFVLEEPSRSHFQTFFLICIVVAAITAGIVISKRIMLVQGFPALLALLTVLAA